MIRKIFNSQRNKIYKKTFNFTNFCLYKLTFSRLSINLPNQYIFDRPIFDYFFSIYLSVLMWVWHTSRR